MVKKSDLIREMLEDGMTPKEIAEELDVPVQTVYNIRYRDKFRKRKEEIENVQDIPSNEVVEDRETVDASRLVRKTRFPEEQEESAGEETYECGACGSIWYAPADEYQSSCPVCGVEFE